ncbi:hypothetical protein CISIN_1g038987mg [Citrus sinensis]|uniref:WLM domain-containing protein n=1 Tax=Citrus sinensis TaxID=2711 RepID=A0A067F6G6_CITSI|nr:hypothetical protein CISIN_1g038987mg [Citrus sinensis]
MRNHKWKVKLLSEMHSKNALGSNLGAGVHIKLLLRKLNRDRESLPFHEVLDTMLHELCHNDIAPHDAKFYKLWEELREECDELRSKGITGVGSFDRPGRVLGGVSPQPPLSSLPQTALAAAEKRAHSNSLLPSGPKLLGGDRFVMYDLSPVQAAAMAVEKRLQYDLWCASQDLVDMGQNIGHSKIICGPITNALDTISRKRNRASNISSESNSVDLEAGTSTSEPMLNHNARTHKSCSGSVESSGALSSAFMRNSGATHNPEEPAMWECKACTFLNHGCGSVPHQGDASANDRVWTCKFWTLENCVKLDKCSRVSK